MSDMKACLSFNYIRQSNARKGLLSLIYQAVLNNSALYRPKGSNYAQHTGKDARLQCLWAEGSPV
jgi:hypothetical protein